MNDVLPSKLCSCSWSTPGTRKARAACVWSQRKGVLGKPPWGRVLTAKSRQVAYEEHDPSNPKIELSTLWTTSYPTRMAGKENMDCSSADPVETQSYIRFKVIGEEKVQNDNHHGCLQGHDLTYMLLYGNENRGKPQPFGGHIAVRNFQRHEMP